jgi:hypothetical protein
MKQELVLLELKKLKKKAEQNRQMHLSISKTAHFQNRLLHACAIIGSCITAILTFAEFTTFLPWFPELTESTYKLIIGTFAGFIFIITVLEEYLRLGNKSATHETIGKQLTTFIRTVSALETYEELSKAELDKVTGEYSTIHEGAPTIPDRVFLREKQRLNIKIDISKKLEKKPYMSVNFYRLKMKFRQLFYQNKDGESLDE